MPERRCGIAAELAKVGDFLGGERQVQQVIDHLRESGGQHEIAVRRQAADGEFEDGALGGLAGLEIAGGHGELVEIGEETVHRSRAASQRCS